MENKVRAARLEDLVGIMPVLYQLSPKKEEDEKISEYNLKNAMFGILDSGNYHMAVYEDAGKVVGTATLLLQFNLTHGARPYGHIENVVTDSSYRGKGVGKALIDYLVDKAKRKGCYKVVLNCSDENVPFYQKCGFKKTSEVEMRLDI